MKREVMSEHGIFDHIKVKICKNVVLMLGYCTGTYEFPEETFDVTSTGRTLQGLIYRLLMILPQTPAIPRFKSKSKFKTEFHNLRNFTKTKKF